MKKYHIVRTIPKSIRKISIGSKIGTLPHKYMTAHIPGLVQTLQHNVAVASEFYEPKGIIQVCFERFWQYPSNHIPTL